LFLIIFTLIVPAYGHRKAESDDESHERYTCADYKIEILSLVLGDRPLAG
jgi:hypothetical protein